MKKVVPLLALAAAVACSESTAVDTPLELSLSMADRVVEQGDSALFTVTAHNPSEETVRFGMCGYSLDVMVVTPDRDTVSVYDAMLGGGVPNCMSRWYHQAGPGESVTLPFAWHAAVPAGVYGAYPRIRCSERPCARSTSAPFKVVEGPRR